MPGQSGGQQMPVVLVLGARSELGRRLLPKLASSSYQTIATSRSPQAPSTEQIRWLEGDPVSERPAFLDALRKELDGRPLAGVINLLGSWMRGEPRKVLVETSQWLADALQPLAGDSASAVYVSGTAVYGDRPGERLSEASPTAPKSKMGRWLVAGESVWTEAGFWSAKIIRFPHLYGTADDRVMGLMASGDFFVPGDGENITPHLHWEDAAEAVCRAFGAPAGIYHWSDGSRSTLRQWCDFITEHRGIEALVSYSLDEALEQGVARQLGPHMKDRDVVAELDAVMTAHVDLDTSATAKALELELQYPDPFPVLDEILITPAEESA